MRFSPGPWASSQQAADTQTTADPVAEALTPFAQCVGAFMLTTNDVEPSED